MSRLHRKLGTRIIMLEATLDDVIEFKRNSEEEERQRAMMIGGGTAAAGGLGYAGYKGRQAVINSHGVTDDYGNRVARKGMYKDAAKDGYAATKSAARALPGQIKALPGQARDYAKSVPSRLASSKDAARIAALDAAKKAKRGLRGGFLKAARRLA